MRTLQGLTLGVIALALVLAASAMAVKPVTITTTTYVVVGTSVPGASTGLVLDGNAVTVTAAGAVCPYGGAVCPGPNGNSGYDTNSSAYGGFPAPGAPAWGLVARVGSGAWTQVGSGPTTISGNGELKFAVNDDFLGDNSGSFSVTVTSNPGPSTGSGCTPGWGNGDKNHTHAGAPGQTDDACRPGWGNGDKNHDHGGPPGQVNGGGTTASTDAGPGNGNGKAKGHDKH